MNEGLQRNRVHINFIESHFSRPNSHSGSTMSAKWRFATNPLRMRKAEDSLSRKLLKNIFTAVRIMSLPCLEACLAPRLWRAIVELIISVATPFLFWPFSGEQQYGVDSSRRQHQASIKSYTGRHNKVSDAVGYIRPNRELSIQDYGYFGGY